MRKLMTVLVVAGLAGQAFAADLLDTVKQRGSLKIALEGTYPPFNFKDAKQQLTGFDVEIATEIAKRLKVKPSSPPRSGAVCWRACRPASSTSWLTRWA
ncbi:transporter substrate-binding domain-containing protein [Chromobacterium haemolyticum]|nr:transporter substrate-binding domain-containing protein [Chromobacterium haemolyticum]